MKTGIEPATSALTGRRSNQAELLHRDGGRPVPLIGGVEKNLGLRTSDTRRLGGQESAACRRIRVTARSAMKGATQVVLSGPHLSSVWRSRGGCAVLL